MLRHAYSPNPFVAVRHGPDPYSNAQRALEALTLPPLRGKRVLLKPNAGRHVEPEKGITTHPAVVAAACDFFTRAGATVAVGESTIIGVKPLECLESTGIAAVVRERGLALLDLDQRPARKTPIAGGAILAHLMVCGAIAEFDYVVSIPVMKTHMHCGVSLSLKNMKGCLRGREKVRLHQLPQPAESSLEKTPEKTLDLAIADLAGVLAPDLALIDGTIGMQGLGPSAGSQKRMDLVVAGTDYLAADAVAATLMGFAPAAVPHLRLAAARCGGCIDVERLMIDPVEWRAWISPFEPPPTKLSMEFKGVTLLDKETCSACMSTLLLFLQYHYAEIADYLPLTVALGKGHTLIPPGAVCVGNCAVRAAVKHISVRGCPPVASEILKVLKQHHPPGRARR